MADRPEDTLTAAELADLRADYETGASALRALAARFALSPRALRLLAQRLNFGARPQLAPFQRRGAPPAASPVVQPARKPARNSARAARKSGAPSPETARDEQPKARPAPPRGVSLKPLDMPAMAERLRHAAERELVKINDKLEAGEDVERHARVLASLVKTLGDLARLTEARDAAVRDDVRPWTLDDLNAELEKQIGFLAESEPAAPAAGPSA